MHDQNNQRNFVSETTESTGEPTSHWAIWIIYLGMDLRALEPFEYYTWESTDERTSPLNNIPWESTAEPTSHLNNIPWNRLTSQRAIWIIPWNRLPSQRATSIRTVGKVALYSVVKPSTCALANESPREFELSARDDAIHLLGRLVTIIAQRWRMILLDDLYSFREKQTVLCNLSDD